MTQQAREVWLAHAIEHLRPLFKRRELPENIRASCGWPQGSRFASRTYPPGDNGDYEIFLSPQVDYPMTALAHLLHEMAHCATHPTRHNQTMTKLLGRLGFVGDPHSLAMTDALRAHLLTVLNEVGPYPHVAVSKGTRKQTTRMLKAHCARCGFTFRASRRCMDMILRPMKCPCCYNPLTLPDEEDSP